MISTSKSIVTRHCLFQAVAHGGRKGGRDARALAVRAAGSGALFLFPSAQYDLDMANEQEHDDIDFVLQRVAVQARHDRRAADPRPATAAKCSKCGWKWACCRWRLTGRPDGEHPGGVRYLPRMAAGVGPRPGRVVRAERRAVHGDRPRVRAVLSSADLLPGAAAVRPGGGRRRIRAAIDGLRGRAFAQPAMDSIARAVPPLRAFPPHSSGGDAGVGAAWRRDGHRDHQPGLDEMREVFAKFGAEEQFDQDELVGQLAVMKESLREEYHVGKTLAEQLADAVAAEEYERAARLRDEIAKQQRKRA